jgi:RNase H-like protein
MALPTPIPSKVGSPRIILWDIETTHNLVAVFKLLNQDYIQAENILQERYIVCAAWKELGKEPVHAVSTLDDATRFHHNPHDDRHVVGVLHRVLSDADVIIAHNGDSYDIKFTEARMLYHGLRPLPPIVKIDTLKAARNRFLFNANNLDYLGHFLKVGRKKPTMGGLWLRVLKGDRKAIEQMVAYNKQDVRLLERVFKKLRPYMPDHVNRQLFGLGGCPRCGSTHTIQYGTHRASTRIYQRYQCKACGGWFRDNKSAGSTNTRVL